MNSNSKWGSKPGNSSQGKVVSGSKNGPRKSCGNAFGYCYTSSELQVLLLTRSCFPAVCMKKMCMSRLDEENYLEKLGINLELE